VNGIFERLRDVLLTNDIVKSGWAIFSSGYNERHNDYGRLQI
jgi:hypothetical protein